MKATYWSSRTALAQEEIVRVFRASVEGAARPRVLGVVPMRRSWFTPDPADRMELISLGLTEPDLEFGVMYDLSIGSTPPMASLVVSVSRDDDGACSFVLRETGNMRGRRTIHYLTRCVLESFKAHDSSIEFHEESGRI